MYLLFVIQHKTIQWQLFVLLHQQQSCLILLTSRQCAYFVCPSINSITELFKFITYQFPLQFALNWNSIITTPFSTGDYNKPQIKLPYNSYHKYLCQLTIHVVCKSAVDNKRVTLDSRMNTRHWMESVKNYVVVFEHERVHIIIQ